VYGLTHSGFDDITEDEWAGIQSSSDSTGSPGSDCGIPLASEDEWEGVEGKQELCGQD